MNTYIVALIIYLILVVIGFLLSMSISMLKCSKTSASTSFTEGLVWATLPALLNLTTILSPYVLSIFSVPLQSYMSLSPESGNTAGAAYLMMLGSWIMTTRMIHTTESAVCKPSKDELAKFQADLQKELEEKEKEKDAKK